MRGGNFDRQSEPANNTKIVFKVCLSVGIFQWLSIRFGFSFRHIVVKVWTKTTIYNSFAQHKIQLADTIDFKKIVVLSKYMSILTSFSFAFYKPCLVIMMGKDGIAWCHGNQGGEGGILTPCPIPSPNQCCKYDVPPTQTFLWARYYRFLFFFPHFRFL